MRDESSGELQRRSRRGTIASKGAADQARRCDIVHSEICKLAFFWPSVTVQEPLVRFQHSYSDYS